MLDATPRPAAHFGQGTGSILRQYLQCSGTESRLVDCPTSSSTCTHVEDVGVTCLPTGISMLSNTMNDDALMAYRSVPGKCPCTAF